MTILPSPQPARFAAMARGSIKQRAALVGMTGSRSRYGNCAALPAIALLWQVCGMPGYLFDGKRPVRRPGEILTWLSGGFD